MTTWFKGSLLLAAALLIPACGDSNKKSAAPAGAPGNVLFSEEFDTVFPGTQWTAVLTRDRGGSAIVDGAAGAPAPSLAMTMTDDPASVSTATVMAFSSRPLTVSVQMSASGDGEGSGGIGIFDSAGEPIAIAEWHPESPSAITLRILGTTLGVTAPPDGPAFHTFTFSVTSSGEASWTIDGAAIPAMTQSGFPSDMVNVNLYVNTPSTTASDFATFRFDNVTVSSP